MRGAAALAGALFGLAILHAARAEDGPGAVVQRVRAEGVLRCGAVERPGIAEAPSEGGAIGVAVDVCRAVAIAVLGPQGRITFSLYEAPHSFDKLRGGADQLAFLTGGEIAAQALGADLLPGPTVAIVPVAVMVPGAAPVRRLADLSGQTLCLMIGSLAQRALEATAGERHLAIVRLAFEEEVEMRDAYAAGRCGAVTGEAMALADMRRTPDERALASRLLPESLAADPVIAVTRKTDGAWAALVAWVFDALLLADVPPSPWRPDGAAALPAGDIPGLRPAWRTEVAATLGGYAAIVRRNLTERLGLAAGPNALWPDGMMLPPAVR